MKQNSTWKHQQAPMLPKEALECKTHEILKARMRADLRVYKEAVDALEESAGGGFEKAHRLAEIARIAYEAARNRFNAHVSSHRCEVRYLRYGTVRRLRT
jgi:hypothetical protein